MAHRVCPFYQLGFTSIGFVQGENTNRCGLILKAHSPCEMELEGNTPQWNSCPRDNEGNHRAIAHSGLLYKQVIPISGPATLLLQRFEGLDTEFAKLAH